MKVLVVGSGGREHALAWKFASSPGVEMVYVAPGNAGTGLEKKCRNVACDVMDLEGLARFAREEAVDLTVVGPEAPLVAGLVDLFEARGLRCFGPSRAASRLEGSKAFAKDFMHRHGIPTADYGVFEEIGEAEAFLRSCSFPLVVKADGLAAGKGVVVAESEEAALQSIREMLSGKAFGEAGRRIVLETFLSGEEASFIAIVDGEDVLPLASSQDHKARDNGDKGPNTGGMGAYSPAPVITEALHERVMAQVILPTVRGLASEGLRYRGFLYAGLMMAEDGSPKVLEYNCRFGDPETQPIVMRLQSDLFEICLAAVEGRLAGREAAWDPRPSLGVVMASGGYPEGYAKGFPIAGLPQVEEQGLKVFHAGTSLRDGRVVTNGGRVLCVTALGTSVQEARDRAYGQVGKISWEGVFYRTDIGHRALAREGRQVTA